MGARGSKDGSSITRGRGWVALALAGALLIGACSDDDGSSGSSTSSPTSTTLADTTSNPTTTGGDTSTTVAGGDGTGVDPGAALIRGIRLSEGTASAGAAVPVPTVDGTPLDQATIEQIQSRLPAWELQDMLTTAFNWPTETRPAPVAGTTVDVPFPAADEVVPPEAPTGPLHVLRVQPDGEVDIAPFVSITFDQPMVPVGTVGQVNASDVPATIEPAIAGRWQWIGTKTLRFDADSDVVDRLPMATTFTVTVPAGTVSATGGALAEAATFEFTTPPVQVLSLSPQGESLPLTPIFLATFDQRVDPAAVLATTHLRADGDEVDIRLATDAEVAADESIAPGLAALADGRWLAFRPVAPLPTSADLSIEIGPGTPSAEGPARTAEAATFEGRTYDPLEVLSAECSSEPTCFPGSSIVVTLNNELDADAFDPSTIAVDPAIPGMLVAAYGSTIEIRGATAGRTEYTVTVPATLVDVHGQQLGRAESRTVRIGESAPALAQFTQPFTTLDPTAPAPTLPIVTVNHDDVRVRVFRVQPTDWSAYVQYMQAIFNAGDDSEPDAPPFELLHDEVVQIASAEDRAVETAFDLSPYLTGGRGHVVVMVEPTEPYTYEDEFYWQNRPSITWAQGTGIGIDAIGDARSLHAWTTDLATGAPLAGVQLALIGGAEATATTDVDGLAAFDLGGGVAIVATNGDDVALLPNSYYGGSWGSFPLDDQALWYVFDDRGVYKPGETVSIKGWVRRLTTSADAQLALLAPGASVGYVVTDGQGSQIADGTAEVNPLGGFDLTFDVPADANLGFSYVQLTLAGAGALPNAAWSHDFQIQEFRRPEYEVAARNDSAGPYVQGAPLTLAVDANYYAGGPLGDAPVAWTVTTSSASYAPPGWDEYTFGEWTPWWYADVDFGFPSDRSTAYEPCCFGGPASDETSKRFDGVTDADGSHYLQVDVGAIDDPDLAGLPVAVRAQASVTDLNRQTLAGETTALVHPADVYVGLRSADTYVEQGEPLDIEAIVSDIDGAPVAGRPVQVTISRVEQVWQDGTIVEQLVDPTRCDSESAAGGPVTCSITPTIGGEYSVVATVTDEAGRTSRSELTRWVSGASTPPVRDVERQELTIVPDLETYVPGTSAHLLVQSPFPTGDGLLTVTRNGIVSTTHFTVTEGSAVIDVPLADADIPGVDVSIEVVGAVQRTADDGTALPDAPLRPAFATGALHLPISLASRTLDVAVTPAADAVQPGAQTSVGVTVTDASGQPVADADLAVVVVDEAVLAVSGYQLGDPLETFYGRLPDMISSQYGRDSIVLTDPLALAGQSVDESASATTAAATETTTAGSDGSFDTAVDGDNKSAIPASPSMSGGAASRDASGAPVAVRSNFDALAVWAPSVTTDGAGQATIDVPLPDNLTRYRVMVVAASGADRFGAGEANITARLPLMVRPSAPRFLNFGDTFELPVLLQNQTDSDMTVDVVVQSDNLELTGEAGKQVTVPANSRVEVRFGAAAAQPGTARFRVSAVAEGSDAADAATIDLPVYTPATVEAFATYGTVDSGGVTAQPVVAPTDVIPQFGSLDVSTSSTALQALTDAVLYIERYDYESTDAMASRILAISSLGDVLQAFDTPDLPSPDAMKAAVVADVAALVALQNPDGGFPYWERGRDSEPYNSIQATHALVVAQADGYAVPQVAVQSALGYLLNIEQHVREEWGIDAADALSAYALFVRDLAGDRDSAKAQALFDERDGGADMALDALAWLWPVIDDSATSDEIERIVTNRAVDTAGAVSFTTDVSDGDVVTLRSDRRTDGLILDDLIALRPQSDLIPKIVKGLLGAQTTGRWGNIQENAFILMAMKHYFDTFEAATPDFVARVWLGDRYAGEHDFRGRTTETAELTVPTSDVIANAAAGGSDVTIANDGTGLLYYRIGMRTAPSSLDLDPLDRGFTVARTYEAVDDPADVTRDPDGTWHIEAGARVRVRLTMVAESQRTHVALIDPLPAGFEILNPSLATTPDVPDDPNAGCAGGTFEGDVASAPCPIVDSWFPWTFTWFDHQNLRDDRAEAFATYLAAGTYDYSYVATATTPGSFVVPPVRAEEMYMPETFGRASTDHVVVEG